MKTIKVFEDAIANQVPNLKDAGINATMFWAYRNSLKAGADELNFDEVIWDYDIDYIVNTCRAEGIERITISSTFSSLAVVVWELTKRGCAVEGMKLVPTAYTHYDWETKKEIRDQVPAFIIKIN